MITVFTPTYNRASFLRKQFESLSKQTLLDFEWLIVDDGSIDDTRNIVEQIRISSLFKIRYFYKKNGGKHTAINLGVAKARGDLFLILDSDDELPPDALETLQKVFEPIKDKSKYGGVCGYIAHRDGRVIGHPLLSADVSTIDLRYKLHCFGDMSEVYRTEVLKEFPFPEIKGEKFCPEVLVWNRISQKYIVRVYPKVMYFRDYLKGGLTDNIIRLRMQSPYATMMTYAEMLKYKEVPLLGKIRSAINYWRFWCCRQDNSYPVIDSKWLWAFLFGIAMHCVDLFKTR